MPEQWTDYERERARQDAKDLMILGAGWGQKLYPHQVKGPISNFEPTTEDIQTTWSQRAGDTQFKESPDWRQSSFGLDPGNLGRALEASQGREIQPANWPQPAWGSWEKLDEQGKMAHAFQVVEKTMEEDEKFKNEVEYDFDQALIKRIPFAGSAAELAEQLDLGERARRITQGKGTVRDYLEIAKVMHNADYWKDEANVGERVGAMTSSIATFGAEFAMTAGTAPLAKKIGTKVATKLAGKVGLASLLKKYAGLSVKKLFSPKNLKRSLVMGPTMAGSIYHGGRGNVGQMEATQDGGFQFAEEEDSAAVDALEAMGMAYAEIAIEELLPHGWVDKLTGGMKAKLTRGIGRLFGREAAEQTGRGLTRRAAFGGVLEELTEERMVEIANVIIARDTDELGVLGMGEGSGKQLMDETISMSAMQVAHLLPGRGSQRAAERTQKEIPTVEELTEQEQAAPLERQEVIPEEAALPEQQQAPPVEQAEEVPEVAIEQQIDNLAQENRSSRRDFENVVFPDGTTLQDKFQSKAEREEFLEQRRAYRARLDANEQAELDRQSAAAAPPVAPVTEEAAPQQEAVAPVEAEVAPHVEEVPRSVRMQEERDAELKASFARGERAPTSEEGRAFMDKVGAMEMAEEAEKAAIEDPDMVGHHLNSALSKDPTNELALELDKKYPGERQKWLMTKEGLQFRAEGAQENPYKPAEAQQEKPVEAVVEPPTVVEQPAAVEAPPVSPEAQAIHDAEIVLAEREERLDDTANPTAQQRGHVTRARNKLKRLQAEQESLEAPVTPVEAQQEDTELPDDQMEVEGFETQEEYDAAQEKWKAEQAAEGAEAPPMEAAANAQAIRDAEMELEELESQLPEDYYQRDRSDLRLDVPIETEDAIAEAREKLKRLQDAPVEAPPVIKQQAPVEEEAAPVVDVPAFFAKEIFDAESAVREQEKTLSQIENPTKADRGPLMLAINKLEGLKARKAAIEAPPVEEAEFGDDPVAEDNAVAVSQIDKLDVMGVFPGRKVIEDKDGNFDVSLVGGRWRVLVVDKIEMTKGQITAIYNSYVGSSGTRQWSRDNSGKWQTFEEVYPTVESYIESDPSLKGKARPSTKAELEATWDVLGTIEVARGSGTAQQIDTLSHEAVHAAHLSGLWTAKEWAVLVDEYSNPSSTTAQQSEDIAKARQGLHIDKEKTAWEKPEFMERMVDWMNRMLSKIGLAKLSPRAAQNMFFRSAFFDRQTDTSGVIGQIRADQAAARDEASDPTTMAMAEPAEGEDADPQLPKHLSRSSPRYGFGRKNFPLEFSRDLDKALYIIARSGKLSERDSEFLDFVREAFPDKTDAELRAMGMKVRSEIKAKAKVAEDGTTLKIPSQAPSQAPTDAVPDTDSKPKPKPKPTTLPASQSRWADGRSIPSRIAAIRELFVKHRNDTDKVIITEAEVKELIDALRAENPNADQELAERMGNEERYDAFDDYHSLQIIEERALSTEIADMELVDKIIGYRDIERGNSARVLGASWNRDPIEQKESDGPRERLKIILEMIGTKNPDSRKAWDELAEEDKAAEPGTPDKAKPEEGTSDKTKPDKGTSDKTKPDKAKPEKEPGTPGTDAAKPKKKRGAKGEGGKAWKLGEKARKEYENEKARLRRMKKFVEGLGYTWDLSGLKKLAQHRRDAIKLINENNDIMHDLGWPTYLADLITEQHLAMMLQGLSTTFTNLAGMTFGPWREGEQFFGAALNTMTDNTEDRMLQDYNLKREFKHLGIGIGLGIQNGLKSWANFWLINKYDLIAEKTGLKEKADWDAMNESVMPRSFRIPVLYPIGKQIRNTSKFIGYGGLQFFDQLFKTVFMWVTVGVEAATIARKEGLTGRAHEARVQEQVDDLRSKAWDIAKKEASMRLLQDKGGKLSSATIDLAKKGQDLPGGVGFMFKNFVVPFAKVPVRIPAQQLHRLPGTVIGKMGQNIIKGRHVFSGISDRVAGQLAVGILGYIVFNMFDCDDEKTKITGATRESNEAEGARKLRYSKGMKEDQTIEIGDTDWSYGRVDPAGGMIATLVDIARAIKCSDAPADAVNTLFNSLWGQVVTKTYGGGLTNIMKLGTDNYDITDWAADAMGSFVPQHYKQGKRYLREDDNIGHKKSKDPWKQMLMQSEISKSYPMYSHYGELARNTKVLGVKTKSNIPFKGNRLFERYNFHHKDRANSYPAPTKQTYDVGTVEVEMPNKTFSEYQRLSGKLAKRVTDKLISDEMAANPDIHSLKLAQKIISLSKETVKAPIKASQEVLLSGDIELDMDKAVRALVIKAKTFALRVPKKIIRSGESDEVYNQMKDLREEYIAEQKLYRAWYVKNIRKITQ